MEFLRSSPLGILSTVILKQLWLQEGLPQLLHKLLVPFLANFDGGRAHERDIKDLGINGPVLEELIQRFFDGLPVLDWLLHEPQTLVTEFGWAWSLKDYKFRERV